MRSRRTVPFIVAVVCAGAGGPALAAVAARAPRGGASGTIMTATGTTTTSSTATSTTTATTTTATTTTTTTTTTAPPPLVVCLAAERTTLARAMRVPAATIREHQFLGSNGMQQCNYLIARAHRGGPREKVVVTVNVDNGPQPVWRLMRKVVEAGQIFGPIPKGWAPPRGVSGLGPYASWFPNLEQMMANNISRRYLLTVGAIWRGATRPELITLVHTATATYRRVPALPTS
jgi:hypothetical protein